MNVGGTARYISMLSNGLEAAGIESAIATGFVQGAEAEDPSVGSVKLHRINHLGRAINPVSDYQALREFRSLVAQERPSIIHTHTFKAGFIARIQRKALLRAANQDIKFVHTFHGHLLDDPEFSGLKRKLIISIERFLTKHSDRLVTVGQKVTDELLTNEVGNSAQYLNIPPGVAALKEVEQSQAREMLGIKGNLMVIGWLARVTGVKNPLLAAKVAKDIPDAQFAFGGAGDLLDELKNNVPNNCKVFGWVDAATFISASDIILSTSENEGMPVALIEAQLAGKPVVATDVGSVSEVVMDGKTGFVVSKNQEELVAALNKLLPDTKLIESMGNEAKTHAKSSFSPELMINKHIDLYRLLA